MKLFTGTQLSEIDKYTIEHEPIRSLNLMERAGARMVEFILQNYSKQRPVFVIAGPGNNGGDGLVVARRLLEAGWQVAVCLVDNGRLSEECSVNLQRLQQTHSSVMTCIGDNFVPPHLVTDTLVVDALFGVGLSRSLGGVFAQVVDWMNTSGCEVLSIDVPSGLGGETVAVSGDSIVKAHRTLTIELPKLSFFFPENSRFVGNWSAVHIGLSQEIIRSAPTRYFSLEVSDLLSLLKKRNPSAHKGQFGHLLLMAGSRGMAGAALLASQAALRSGVGLLTTHSASCNRDILQVGVPEAMFLSDVHEFCITQSFLKLRKFNALAVGPGIGMDAETASGVLDVLTHADVPMVIDADALNILAKHPECLRRVNAGSILTPHPAEFDRLFGTSVNSFERMKKASEMAMQYQLIIVLKGWHTVIALPNGKLYFNTTGNVGMATAGSGDVLTGIIGGLLAQGYTAEEASILGVYLHGLAGDLALENQSVESLLAGDVVASIGLAYKKLWSDIEVRF